MTTIADKINKDMIETMQRYGKDLEFMQFFADTMAPLIEPLLHSCKLKTDILSAPRYYWPTPIVLEYTGSATNNEEIQEFLREIEDVFGKGPDDWNFALDNSYNQKYADNYNYCGAYQLDIGTYGHIISVRNGEWKGFQIQVQVVWLPPCARLVEETHTITKTDRSYVC